MALNHLGVAQIPDVSALGKGVPRLLFPVFGGYFALGLFLWLRFNARLSICGHVFALVAVGAAIAPFLLDWRKHGHFPLELVAWLSGVAAIIASSFFPGRLADEGAIGRTVRVLGLATYPLYLIHFALGAVSIRALVRAGFAVDAALLLVTLGLVLIAALIATKGEPPIRRGIRRAFATVEHRPFLALLSRPNFPVPEKP